jgi:hypothetical protein
MNVQFYRHDLFPEQDRQDIGNTHYRHTRNLESERSSADLPLKYSLK